MKAILINLIYIYDRYLRHRFRVLYGEAYLKYFNDVDVSVKLHGKMTIWSKNNIKIGKYTRIGQNFFADARGVILIGENVQISRNVIIYSSNHNYDTGQAIPYDNKVKIKKVTIGDSVWIGMNSIILPGVTIGKGAIIGIGAIIYKDVPAYTVVVNSSMKFLKMRDKESFNKMENDKMFFGKLYPND